MERTTSIAWRAAGTPERVTRLLQRAIAVAACAGYLACGSDGDHDRAVARCDAGSSGDSCAPVGATDGPSNARDARVQPDVGRIDARAAVPDGRSRDTGAPMDARRSDSAAWPNDANGSLLDAGTSVPEARSESGVPDASQIPDANTCRGDANACSCDPTPCTCGASGVCGSDTAGDPLRCCNPAEDSCTDPARCDLNPCIPLRCSPDSGLCSQLLPGLGKVPDGTPCEDGNRCSRARPAPVFRRCNVACESDGSPGCAADQECVLLAGSPGSAASGYCCPVGTACLAAGDYCVGNSGRAGPPAQIYDMCRNGECTYDIGPALNDTASVDASAADGSPALADSGGSGTGSDATMSCPPRAPPGGEPSVCNALSCTDPSLNGQYNPCVIASQC